MLHQMQRKYKSIKFLVIINEMRVLLLISLLYRLAATQSVPIDLEINAKCVFPFGTINLKDTFETGTALAPINKRVLTVTGSLSGLCPTSSYTLSFG